MANLAPIFDWRKALVHAESPLSSNARYIGFVLSMYWNRMTMVAFPGQEVLCADAAVSIRRLRRGMTELETCGYLWVEHRKGHANVYHFTLPRLMMAHLQKSMAYPQAQGPAISDGPPDGGQVISYPTPPAEMTAVTRVEPEEPNHAAVKKKGGGEHRLIFGAICEVMGRPPQGGEGAVWGRVAKLMAQAQVPPEEVVIRGNRMKARWTSIPPSPMGLWNNWGQFAEGAGGAAPEPEWKKQLRWEQEMHEMAEQVRAREEAERGLGRDDQGGGGDTRPAPGVPPSPRGPGGDEPGDVGGDAADG